MRLEQAVKIASASSGEIRRSGWVAGYATVLTSSIWISIEDLFADDWEVYYRLYYITGPANDDYPLFKVEIAAAELATHRKEGDLSLLQAVMDLYERKDDARASVINGWQSDYHPSMNDYRSTLDLILREVGYLARHIYEGMEDNL